MQSNNQVSMDLAAEHYIDGCRRGKEAERERALRIIRNEIDMVNHPPHYTTHPSGIEAIEVTRHMNFNLGNATKYIWRAGLKADRVEDLKKARFYINDEINRLEGTN